MKKRILIIHWVILFLVPVVMTSCAKRETPEESIRDRVVSASRGFSDSGESKPQVSGYFADTGFSEGFHRADWAVDDPFTDSTKFFMNPSLLSHSYPYSDTHQALARSLKSEQQVFLVVGSDPMLRSRLDQKMTEWGSSRVSGFPDQLRSADGLDLSYYAYHVSPGLVAGEELLLEVAFFEKNGALLVLDAGLSYGRPPERNLLRAQPELHATLPQLVPTLKLQGLVSR